ncbi:MAG: carboxypeptidase-like regulatory domain-containing protein, partial [Planctomycetaceae bacterium]|nr:carboxypeptidase-like regulatory domain-containing protein [Planctomycetaceae bacterium]
MKTASCQTIIAIFLFLGLGTQLFAGENNQEKTAAELKRLRYVEGNRKVLEKISAVPTTVTGRAILPDGSPAAGFKIGGWGRSMSHIGHGHNHFDTVTDENGWFSLDLYRPFLYWITITDPNEKYIAKDRHLELTEPLEPNALLFQLQEGIPVEGIVINRDTNEPIAGLPLWLIHEPIHLKELSTDEWRELEKRQQVPRKVTTDETGHFKFAALPLKYMVSFDEMFVFQPPGSEDKALYTRMIVAEAGPVSLDFKIPSPWHGRLLQKDGTPAAFYPVDLGVRFDYGSAWKELVTDENGRFMIYRPIAIDSITAYTFDQGQWLYRRYAHEPLKDDFAFQLYAPLTAKGRLVRKATGEPLRNFAFICDPTDSWQKEVVTDKNGDFEISGIYLDI